MGNRQAKQESSENNMPARQLVALSEHIDAEHLQVYNIKCIGYTKPIVEGFGQMTNGNLLLLVILILLIAFAIYKYKY
jgi:hypothetical protein